MERGQDRLLALTSKGSGDVEDTLSTMDGWDSDRNFEDWILRLFDHFGLNVEELGRRSYLLHPGNVITDAFPDLPEDGMSVTFDRQKALSREEIGLMTADHPMVRSSIDLLLSSEAGNSAFGLWEAEGGKAIILEAYYVVECIAPAKLQSDHFLPAVPVRVVVDHAGVNLTADKTLMKAALRPGGHRALLDQPKVTGEIIPKMLKELETLAQEQRDRAVEKAIEEMKATLEAEVIRLKDLREVNPGIGDEEIEAVEERAEALEKALSGARLRLDALRMIYRLPPR